MPIVNFAIPANLDKQIKQVVEKNGFQSKAEFFRFSAISYINSLLNKPGVDEKTRFNYLTSELEKILTNKLGDKDLPSLENQLADIN